jgi:hypothetical protein
VERETVPLMVPLSLGTPRGFRTFRGFGFGENNGLVDTTNPPLQCQSSSNGSRGRYDSHGTPNPRPAPRMDRWSTDRSPLLYLPIHHPYTIHTATIVARYSSTLYICRSIPFRLPTYLPPLPIATSHQIVALSRSTSDLVTLFSLLGSSVGYYE